MAGIRNKRHQPFGLALLLIAFVACRAAAPGTDVPVPSEVQLTDTPAITATSSAGETVMPTSTPLPDPTQTLAATATAPPPPSETPPPTPSPTGPSPSDAPTATPTETYAGPGCLRPPDDYGRVEINGETLNLRTYWMLGQAAALYDGPGDLLRVTQGSYTTGETTSFGTHAGGGALDISIRNPAAPGEVLWDETGAMVLALRQAGFAAWYRAPGDLGPGSPAHIHAIAVGDLELSAAAIEQLSGPGGYFRGLDGLPPEYGGAHPDRHGGPIICPWMIELGYAE